MSDGAATDDDVLALFVESIGMFSCSAGSFDQALTVYAGRDAGELRAVIEQRTQGRWDFRPVTSVASLLVILADLDSEPAAAAELAAATRLANEIRANGSTSIEDYDKSFDAEEALVDAMASEGLSVLDQSVTARVMALTDRLTQPDVDLRAIRVAGTTALTT